MTQQPPPPRDSLDRFFQRVRDTGIRRRLSDRWVAGVCGGVADKIGVDPVVVRVVWGLLLVLGGFGFPAYFLAFSLMADTKGEIPLEKAVRHGDGDSVVLLVFTGIVLVGGLGDGWGIGHDGRLGVGTVALWLVVVAAGLVWWSRSGGGCTGHGRRGRRAGQGTSDQGPTEPSPTDPRPTLPPTVGAPDATPTPAVPADASPDRTAAATWTPAAPDSPATATGPALASSTPSSQASSTPSPPASMTPSTTGAAYVPVRRRRPTLGWPGTAATLGLAVAGAGAVIAASSTGRLHVGSPYVVAAAVALALCSMLLVVIGLAGRRGGFTVPVVVALAITTVGISGQLPLDGPRTGPWSVSMGAGSRSWTPTSLPPGSSYQVGAGDGTLDLTQVGAASFDGREVGVQVGMGDMTVRVPQGTTVEVRSHVGLGDVEVRRADGTTQSVGDGTTTIGTGTPALVLRAQVGLGQLTIEEVAR
ncbi:PspC domain-containing protein [Arsenicicoccus sp. oral taxon 190]|uniref:PspC domain-containing protein n=1 Tax=Arsenicicoccus sp. oral taxon 190 TaxID=1658671 RepID=UPI00067A31FB|nr:PspC domain-containing protein [Arsenicicoccus sp. oral taxon 190]AKT50131.1 hypothetical protein ADJ73_00125 [Arsenicicoccus sp. oral taxon 190]